ncbi:MAG: flagellar hook-associated protein FlgK [Agathobacter sp.]|nr:flagellar hook-associated protein FlgK [Agathobacter sp.]
MPSQFFGLNIAGSGLSAYQAAINTTANNVSNVQKEGYSRQETTLEASAALRVYATYGSTGTGIVATEIKQQRDLYYDSKYWENNSKLGYFDQKLYYLNQVEGYFEDNGVDMGFSTIFSAMFNGLDTLNGGNASDSSVRNQFIYRADNLCTYFNSVANSLQSLQKDLNEEIYSSVSNVNAIGEKIALLNKEINQIEVRGGYANEFRDERALLLDELSGMVAVTTQEYDVPNSYGADLGGTNFTVFINGQILVDGNDYRTLECISDKYKNNQTDAEGMYEIKWADTGTDFAATTGTAGGTLKALFDLRDGNNTEALKGTVTAVTANANGVYDKVTMSDLSNVRINALNIPERGTISVGNKTYEYSGWEAELDADGNLVDITFNLDKPVEADELHLVENKDVVVGKSVDAMGIPYYLAQFDEFLRNFTELFNGIQKKGMTLDGEKMGSFFIGETETGTIYDFDGWGEVDADGNPVAKPTKISSEGEGYHQLTAFNATVNQRSISEPGYFATTKDITNGKDAYDLVTEMMKLQNDTVIYRGDNASAFLERIVSDISVDTEKNTVYYENYFNMSGVITTQRSSVSGVDEDEEALNLVKFQNAYNLSSKVISVLTEIYDKLINQTGVT